jgi:HORMA domain
MASQTLLAALSATARNVDVSAQLCQVFLNSSLACICHTRELLNWSSDCFRKRFIDDISLQPEPEDLYNAFCRTDSFSTKPSQEVRVLVRSDEARANSILDLLVHPVQSH